MPGSHAEEIVVDYFESGDWSAVIDADTEPELDLPPLPPPRPSATPRRSA